jgi:hypothetical protein
MTRSIDAAFAFVDGFETVPAEFLEHLFLTLGVVAENRDASEEVRGCVASSLVTFAGRPNVPVQEVRDRLLDLRAEATGSRVAASA